MRVGVLDIGSNTGHLLVVVRHGGAAPLPASSFKQPLRLAEHLDDAGAVTQAGVDALTSFVADAVRVAEDRGCEDMLAFATSAVRDARELRRGAAHVERATGVELAVLSGGDEARLTFLAVRRWFGWSAGPPGGVRHRRRVPRDRRGCRRGAGRRVVDADRRRTARPLLLRHRHPDRGRRAPDPPRDPRRDRPRRRAAAPRRPARRGRRDLEDVPVDRPHLRCGAVRRRVARAAVARRRCAPREAARPVDDVGRRARDAPGVSPSRAHQVVPARSSPRPASTSSTCRRSRSARGAPRGP